MPKEKTCKRVFAASLFDVFYVAKMSTVLHYVSISLKINSNVKTGGFMKKYKPIINTRIVLNIYGVFATLGLILSIFTHPITSDNNMKLFFDRELMMDSDEIKDFLLFVVVSASVYFCLINLYFSKRYGKE